MKLQFKHYLAAVLVVGLAVAGGATSTKLLARGKRKVSRPPVITEVSLSGTVVAVLPNALTVKIGHNKPSGKASKSSSSATAAIDSGVASDQDDPWFMECTYGPRKKKSPKDSGVWTVYPKPKTAVLVEGTSTLDYLRPGQTVEFTGNLADDTIVNTVDTINVVPKHGHNLNIGGGPGLAKDKESVKSTSLDSANASITARIQAVKDTALVVWVGERTLHLHLTASPTVHVESDDPKLITVGSKVTITGQGVHGPNLAQADSIKVTLAAPISAKKLPDSSFRLPSDSEKPDLSKLAEEKSDSSDEAKGKADDAEKPKDNDMEKPKNDEEKN